VTRELERLLWRYQTGFCSREKIKNALDTEIKRLVNEEQPLYDKYLLEFRRFCPKLLYGFDKGTEAALIHLEEQHFQKTLQDVQKAEIALNGMSKIVEAFTQYESAKNEFEQLVNNLGLEMLTRLMTLRMLDRLLTKASEFLEKNSPRKAIFVLRLYKQEIKVIQTRTVDNLEAKFN